MANKPAIPDSGGNDPEYGPVFAVLTPQANTGDDPECGKEQEEQKEDWGTMGFAFHRRKI